MKAAHGNDTQAACGNMHASQQLIAAFTQINITAFLLSANNSLRWQNVESEPTMSAFTYKLVADTTRAWLRLQNGWLRLLNDLKLLCFCYWAFLYLFSKLNYSSLHLGPPPITYNLVTTNTIESLLHFRCSTFHDLLFLDIRTISVSLPLLSFIYLQVPIPLSINPHVLELSVPNTMNTQSARQMR